MMNGTQQRDDANVMMPDAVDCLLAVVAFFSHEKSMLAGAFAEISFLVALPLVASWHVLVCVLRLQSCLCLQVII
jgi:hypothetical protein